MEERYLHLNAKYVADGHKLLAEKDFPQASEKFWGAVAEMIKAIASERHWSHSRHRDLGIVVRRLREETGDDDLLPLFRSAERLHTNFYEDHLDEPTVGRNVADALNFIEKLGAMAGVTHEDDNH